MNRGKRRENNCTKYEANDLMRQIFLKKTFNFTKCQQLLLLPLIIASPAATENLIYDHFELAMKNLQFLRCQLRHFRKQISEKQSAEKRFPC